MFRHRDCAIRQEAQVCRPADGAQFVAPLEFVLEHQLGDWITSAYDRRHAAVYQSVRVAGKVVGR